MIDRKQLSEALARLDPRDREVLDYSLRRHVPDSDLAAVFGCGASEVARMRAGAVERLADDLGVQRGTDLGQVLTALLDHATWEDVPGATPLDAPVAKSSTGAGSTPPETPVTPATPATPAASTPPAEPTPEERKAVLDMLDRRGPAVAAVSSPPPPSGTGGRRWSLVAAALIGVLVTIGLGSVIVLGDAGSTSPSDENSATRPFEPKEQELGEPFPSEPEPEQDYHYPIAIVEHPVTLLDAPLGERKARIDAKTEWGTPRVLSVVERQGEWLSVLAPELENGEVGWVRESDVARLGTVSWAIKADLTKRQIEVERDGKVIKTFGIGVGREDHPTPTGRFAVTDKLSVTDDNSPYGCCVVALTGHQTKLPEGWPGGDRLAIHATNDVSGLGEAVSLGCMRTDPKDARWLMDSVPLGTPVFISESTPAEPSTTSQGKPAKR